MGSTTFIESEKIKGKINDFGLFDSIEAEIRRRQKILNSTLNKVNLAFLWFKIEKGFFLSKTLFFRLTGWKFCKNFLLCTSCQIIHFIFFTIHLVWKKHVFTFSMRWLHGNFLFFFWIMSLVTYINKFTAQTEDRKTENSDFHDLCAHKGVKQRALHHPAL